MSITRREFIRNSAIAATATAAGVVIPGVQDALAQGQGDDGIKWDKGVCRYCGTGCGVLVGVQRRPRRRDAGRPGRAGEQGPELHQGLLPRQDHVRQGPADGADAAHEGRQVRQGRRVHADHLEAGVRRDGGEVQGDAEGQGADGRRHVRLGPVDGVGRLRGEQAVQSGLPLEQRRPERAPLHGLGRDGVHAHVRRRRADGLLRRRGARRRVRAVGLEHGRDAPDPVVAHHRPAPEREARQDRRAVHLSATARASSPTSRSSSSRRPISRS